MLSVACNLPPPAASTSRFSSSRLNSERAEKPPCASHPRSPFPRHRFNAIHSSIVSFNLQPEDQALLPLFIGSPLPPRELKRIPEIDLHSRSVICNNGSPISETFPPPFFLRPAVGFTWFWNDQLAVSRTRAWNPGRMASSRVLLPQSGESGNTGTGARHASSWPSGIWTTAFAHFHSGIDHNGILIVQNLSLD